MRFRAPWRRKPEPAPEMSTLTMLAVLAPMLVEEHGVHITLVADEIASEYRVWSEPGQFMFSPGLRVGTLDLVFRPLPEEVEA